MSDRLILNILSSILNFVDLIVMYSYELLPITLVYQNFLGASQNDSLVISCDFSDRFLCFWEFHRMKNSSRCSNLAFDLSDRFLYLHN
ncbi:MAG: hypothetical protein F6K22_08585 [Okeania sp. SIO2F4]|uniref:hypothetical protein n=1 Tax=Okeania sp. SIO2F4 TaxID=2607790 RepID=UPI0014290A48|nr:hypothetical protein [Okeania sp. SIO2F4]NES02896.1 hypothetical protein [Okeania sp. SIO2F4]